MTRETVDQAAADDLRIFIDNDAELYRQMTTMIMKNLMTKRARGEYDPARAVQAFTYLTEAGAKKYARNAGGSGAWNELFSVPTRREAARQLAESFEEEAALGNHDDLLPKKYQAAAPRSGGIAASGKSKRDLEADIARVTRASTTKRRGARG